MSQQVAKFILAVIRAVTICNCFPLPLRGQKFALETQLSAEVIALIGLSFEIAVIEMREDEIQNGKLRANVLDRMLALVAQVFAGHGSIDELGVQVVDTPIA